MVQWAGVSTGRVTQPRWLTALYVVLVASALALLTLVVGEIYYAFESANAHVEHEHGVFGPIFDLAWFVFLPTAAATLLATVVASIVGRVNDNAALKTYSLRAAAYLALAVGVIAIVGLLES